jgi:hypothetical protein
MIRDKRHPVSPGWYYEPRLKGGTPAHAPTPFSLSWYYQPRLKGLVSLFFVDLSVYSNCCLTRICTYTYLNLYICIYLSIYTIYTVRLIYKLFEVRLIYKLT